MYQHQRSSFTWGLRPTWHIFPGLLVWFDAWDRLESCPTAGSTDEAGGYASGLVRARQKGLQESALHCSSNKGVKLTRHPFDGVQSSKAIQVPIALGGSVYRNVESLWVGTADQTLAHSV
jgi:hypothetical protein